MPGLVPGYWKGATGWQLGNAGLHLSASGSLTGSGRALAIWGQAVLANRGPAAELLAEQAAPRHLLDGRATAYGLGLAHGRLGPVALVGHGGSHAGYKTYLLLAPEPGLGIVVVSNREDTGAYGLALRTMAALLGQEMPPRPACPKVCMLSPAPGIGWRSPALPPASSVPARRSTRAMTAGPFPFRPQPHAPACRGQRHRGRNRSCRPPLPPRGG
ncbi:serine hydrolase [Pseudoroseomonas wenyumeiae]